MAARRRDTVHSDRWQGQVAPVVWHDTKREENVSSLGRLTGFSAHACKAPGGTLKLSGVWEWKEKSCCLSDWWPQNREDYEMRRWLQPHPSSSALKTLTDQFRIRGNRSSRVPSESINGQNQDIFVERGLALSVSEGEQLFMHLLHILWMPLTLFPCKAAGVFSFL